MSDSLIPASNNLVLYVRTDLSFLELIERAKEHFEREWPEEEFNPEDYTIGHEHFHARCIGYDLYDSSDYDDYITISRNF